MLAEAQYKKKGRKKPGSRIQASGTRRWGPQLPFSWMFSGYLDRPLSSEDTCMVNIPLKRCSLLLTISDKCIIDKVCVTAPRCKQPTRSSGGKSINTIWYIYMIAHPSPIKIKIMTDKCNIMDDFQKLFLRNILRSCLFPFT